MKKHIRNFLITGITTTIVSLIGLVVLFSLGYGYIINPRSCILGMMFCVMGMIMGLGWAATAITSHIENKEKLK